LVYVIASFIDRANLQIQPDNVVLFQRLSLSHVFSAIPSILAPCIPWLRGERGWKISYALLSNTAFFQLGLEAGYLWFKEKVCRLETVFRMTAFLASFFGVWVIL
ncbi:MAG: hypothetical protein EB127_16980, partial [Alphaproteobacteria bacterium]|nr:hypothetical protein [Alphaproteobacteria bacterium]